MLKEAWSICSRSLTIHAAWAQWSAMQPTFRSVLFLFLWFHFYFKNNSYFWACAGVKSKRHKRLLLDSKSNWYFLMACLVMWLMLFSCCYLRCYLSFLKLGQFLQDPQNTVEASPSAQAQHETQGNHQDNPGGDAPVADSGSISIASSENRKVSREDIELVRWTIIILVVKTSWLEWINFKRLFLTFLLLSF